MIEIKLSKIVWLWPISFRFKPVLSQEDRPSQLVPELVHLVLSDEFTCSEPIRPDSATPGEPTGKRPGPVQYPTLSPTSLIFHVRGLGMQKEMIFGRMTRATLEVLGVKVFI